MKKLKMIYMREGRLVLEKIYCYIGKELKDNLFRRVFTACTHILPMCWLR